MSVREKPLSVIKAAEKWSNRELKNEIYHLDEKITKEWSEINSTINPVKQSIEENLSWKIKESFSWLDEERHHLAAMTFWDLEHSYWWNRLFIKSKIMDAIKEWKEFSYASYDLNWMWISNELSKSLWNLRILELSHISHEIVKYLKNLWYNETFFSRNWWDEFSMFTTAPAHILKNAFDHWRKKELWRLKDVLKEEEYNKVLIDVKNKKWWKNEKEWLAKISWFTVWINSYNFNWVKVENLENEYKKITTWTDEFMEHYKSWKLKDEYISWIKEYINNEKIKEKIKESEKIKLLKIVDKLNIERNYQKSEKDENKLDKNSETIESLEIRNLWLNKKIENELVTIIEWFLWWESQIIIWNYTKIPKSWKENAEDNLNFKESNELSDQQNKKFAEIWEELEENIREQFYKRTKKRNWIVEKFKLSEKESQELDYYLWKAKYREEEINKIKEIIDISKEEIQELKVEYIRALFIRWHYTWSYQPQASTVIAENPETGFSVKNKIVIDSPSFKSINELSWHTNWDYFIMAYVKYMKDEMMKTFNEFWISKKEFWENIIIISKWPNTEIFIKDSIIEKYKWIKDNFKDKIRNSNFLEEFNNFIWEDENWKELTDKRIDFIKKHQKDKYLDIKKEIILIKLWKNSPEYKNEKYWEILSEYEKSDKLDMDKIEELAIKRMKKELNTFEILK